MSINTLSSLLFATIDWLTDQCLPSSKVPAFVKFLAPKGSLEIHEEAWNAYPYCKTVITVSLGATDLKPDRSSNNILFDQNPDYMKNNFHITIETMHAPDKGTQENAHELTGDKLKQREVIFIDIANDNVLTKVWLND